MTDARTSLGGMSVELSISWRAGLHVGKLHAEALGCDGTRSLCGVVTLAAFGAKENSSVPRCKRCTRIAGAALRAARKAFERRTLRPSAPRPRNPVPVDGIASEGMA